MVGTSRSWRETVDAAYSDEVELFYEDLDSIVDQSLNPRGPSLFFDVAERLGLGSTWHALDVGSRAGRHLVEVHDRFGCRVTGVEPAVGNLARMRRTWGDQSLSVARGVAESLPFADRSFDLVWARDVLVHVEALDQAFSEMKRVLRPGAPIVVYQMFATPLLEPREAERLWLAAAAVPASTDRGVFEQAIHDADLDVEARDGLGSEWREYSEEHGGQSTSQQLLRVARLMRRPDHYRAAIGELAYDIEIGNCLYGIYQMIGKISPSLYVLR